jgi:RNA polymerase sigma-70 factor (ECF subfamily)
MYYDYLPYEEISKIIDMSVGTLKTNYHYAKDKVEQYIKDNYSQEF